MILSWYYDSTVNLMVSITSRISLGYRSCYQCYDKENKCRPLFSRFLGFCQNILNVTEKQTRKTCFLHLALHIYHANFSFDGNKYGGGIILYVQEHIHSIKYFGMVFFLQTNLHKKAWLFNCSYNLHMNDIARHLELISSSLDTFFHEIRKYHTSWRF